MDIQVDHEKCIGCGNCELRCPKMVYIINEDNKAVPIRKDYCIHCWICVGACPTGAIKININQKIS
ncbi:MAG: 4Fe-4S binding protein [Candidatus Helarchaeota archaeon]